jgi:cyanate permease
MMNTGFGIAGMISPTVFGFLIQTTGSYLMPFEVSAALLAIGAVCSFFIDPTRKVEAEQAPSTMRIIAAETHAT